LGAHTGDALEQVRAVAQPQRHLEVGYQQGYLKLKGIFIRSFNNHQEFEKGG
jgi:hypothetical protein